MSIVWQADEKKRAGRRKSEPSSAKREPSESKLKIAIDGPAGAGKSTVAKKVAEALGYLYIDTGAMYRAATWLALSQHIPLEDSEAVVNAVANATIRLEPDTTQKGGKPRVFVNGEDVTDAIRTQQISQLVSPLSTIRKLRDLMLKEQRAMAECGGVVLDGRDIGTVVMPDAEVKIFLTASPEVRAERRVRDLEELGERVDYNVILLEINERDLRDSTRTVAPLKQADDAKLIDTDKLTVEQVVEKILKLTRSRAVI